MRAHRRSLKPKRPRLQVYECSRRSQPLPFDVLLMSYTMFERDSHDAIDDRKFLRTLSFSHAVMDEAHLVKNRSSQRARKLRRLIVDCCHHRLMLTGTPLQNDLARCGALFTHALCQLVPHWSLICLSFASLTC